ncbi:MAG: tetratricopeptide repeat protein [Gemmataceae bacterium]
MRNANPYDGEPLYNLGLCLRCRLDATSPKEADRRFDDTYAAFYKATWNQAWAAAGYHALAEMDCRRGDWPRALDHLRRALRHDTDNLRARDLLAIVLRRLGQTDEADALLAETLALDPLDWWARYLTGQPLTCDHQTLLDTGPRPRPRRPVRRGNRPAGDGHAPGGPADAGARAAWPMIAYTLGWLCERAGDNNAAQSWRREAVTRSPDYCFPARLEEIAVLESAMRADATDARAPYYLGNLFYDRRRHDEAIAMWERCVALDQQNAMTRRCWEPDRLREVIIAHRNLGIAYHNVRHNLARTAEEFIGARGAAGGETQDSARLLYEWDQMCKRFGEGPQDRLGALEERLELVRQRDDLSIELCRMLNQMGEHDRALEILAARRFQPWEGGEGQALGEYVRTRLALGQRALANGNAAAAVEHFEAALNTPENLGEARHLLANASDVHYWLGEALAAEGDPQRARNHWYAAATFRGDFQEMSVRTYSEMTYYSALAWRRLGRPDECERLLTGLLDYAQRLEAAEARVDYFATLAQRCCCSTTT